MKNNEMGRAFNTYGGRGCFYRLLVGRPDGKRPLWRSRHRRENNNKMNIKEVGWERDGIDLVQDRDRWWATVNAVMELLAL